MLSHAVTKLSVNPPASRLRIIRFDQGTEHSSALSMTPLRLLSARCELIHCNIPQTGALMRIAYKLLTSTGAFQISFNQ